MNHTKIAEGLRRAEQLIGEAQRYNARGELVSPSHTKLNVGVAIGVLEAVLKLMREEGGNE